MTMYAGDVALSPAPFKLCSEFDAHDPCRDLPRNGFQQLWQYWNLHRSSGRLPARSQILPEDLKEWLPHIVLFDVVKLDDAHRFRVRLIGTAFSNLLGQELSGKFLDETFSGARYVALHCQLATVVARKAPVYGVSGPLEPPRDFISYAYLTLPLASDGEEVDMLLGIRRELPMSNC